ncbi:hypothetical protein FRC03_001073 [Tulasnella sp. 419]|nr:hypothetical protein FRC03_001073 [Tulasnella sp. 419]
MNRHHPYGGYDEPLPRRRSASPPYRGGGRGRGRPGRGGGARGGYNAPPSHMSPSGYDAYASHVPQYSEPPYPPPQGPDYGGYPAADPSYDPYPPPQYSSGSRADPYEDYAYGEPGYGRGGPPDRGMPEYERGRGGGPGRGRRRVRDDKVHDSIIEERINRERPCRTLFIRNIKYESNSDDIRRKFEEHGEIKTFFDLIKNRGMVFVTYYDLRAAEKAREQLQGMEISNRPIDVHYSLPREHEIAQRCDRDKNQGTVLVTLVNSATRQPIDEMEVRRKFQQFGDIKTVKPVFQSGIIRPDQRYVEMFDSRAAVSAHDTLRDQPLQDGIMDLVFEWDVPDMPLPGAPVALSRRSPGPSSRYDEPPHRADSIERGIGPMRGGPPPPWERRGPPPPHVRDDYRDRREYPAPMSPRDYRDDRDRRPSYPPPPPPPERGGPAPYAEREYGREGYAPRGERYSGRGGPPGARGGRDDFVPDRQPRMSTAGPGTDEFGRTINPNRVAEERSSSFDAGRNDAYPPRTNEGNSYNYIPPSAAAPSPDDRLEQAKKVQQLLAALKPGTSAASAPAPAPAPATSSLPPIPAQQHTSQPYYGVPSGHPPFPPTGGAQPPFSFNQPPSSLPPAPYGANAPPPPAALGNAGAPSAAGVQSLLALLAQNQNR